MRVWSEASFAAATQFETESAQSIVWLRSRPGPRNQITRLSRTLDAIDRAGTRAGRASALLVAGCLACSAIPNSAIAPVGSAIAAPERMKLQPAWPSSLENVAAPAALSRADLPATAPSRSVVPSNSVANAPLAPPVGNMRPAAVLHGQVSAAHLGAGESVRSTHSDLEAAPTAAATADQAQWPSFEADRAEVEEFLRFGSREVPRRLVETIVRAALVTDVDPIYLMALADKESSFRPEVKASSSSAQGLFQFIDRTWLEALKSFGSKHGLQAEADAITTVDDKLVIADENQRARILQLRCDPYIAAVIAAEMLRRDATQIGFKIGRQLNPTEMYLAHFLGLQGAARFINLREAKKARSATTEFPAAARANSGIFFERGKKGRRGLSVPEVYAKIDRMMDARLELYRPVRVYIVSSLGI